MASDTTVDVFAHLKNRALLRESAFINGEWRGGEKTIPVHNPATGDIVGHVPDFGIAQTNEAIAAAHAAFPAWRALPAGKRSALLEAWHHAVVANVDDLARI